MHKIAFKTKELVYIKNVKTSLHINMTAQSCLNKGMLKLATNSEIHC